MEKVFLIIISILVLFIVACSDTTSPKINAPSNLELTLVENNIIMLTWQDNSTDETKFFVDRKKGEYEWYENYFELDENITSCIDEIQTTTDTVYSYRVRAYNGDKYSEYSIPTGWFADCAAPINLVLEQISQDSIKLVWYDNSIGELGFGIDRRISNGNWIENYDNIEENNNEYIDYNPSLNDTCYYRICAISGNTKSNYCSNFIVPIWQSPSNFEIQILSENSLELTWQDNTIDEDGFKIDRKVDFGDWIPEYVVLNENITDWIDTDVEEFHTYYYRLYAFKTNLVSFYNENSIFLKISENILYVPEEYLTIQSAIMATSAGDTVLIAPGTYYENIHNYYNGYPIVIGSKYLISGNSDFITQTIIDGNQSDHVVTFSSSSPELIGLTITNGQMGICCYEDTTPFIQNVIVKNNSLYGIYSGCNGISLKNVIITNNELSGFGGVGIWANYLENVTITDNSGYGIMADDDIDLINCILYNNELGSINNTGSPSVTFSNIQGSWEGEGNIDSDPLFVDPPNNDYHLQVGSPCIDTGNPNSQYNDPDGSRNDMGAYGGANGEW